MKILKRFFIWLTLMCFCNAGYNQSNRNSNKTVLANKAITTNKALDSKLDSIFSSFNKTTPGVAVTVIDNGKVIAKKSLWYGKPGTQYSIYT